MQRQLFIMVKEPRPGRVKTRLGATLGMTKAAWWFRNQSASLIRRTARDPRWQTTLAVAPDLEGLTSRIWPRDITRIGQGQGDLGDRMRHVFQSAAPGPCLIIGADIPGVTRAHIWRGFEQLKSHDAVFGPASDGGYWMIGLRGDSRPLPSQLFQDIRWSSQHALQDTQRSLGSLSVGFATTLDDVDTEADLKRLSQSRF